MLNIKAGDVVKLKDDNEYIRVESVDHEKETFLFDAGSDYQYEYNLNDVHEVYRMVK